VRGCFVRSGRIQWFYTIIELSFGIFVVIVSGGVSEGVGVVFFVHTNIEFESGGEGGDEVGATFEEGKV